MHIPETHYVFAGAVRVAGKQMACRLPGRTITLNAPPPLLNAVAGMCDGELTAAEIVAQLTPRWGAAQIGKLLDHLLDVGVLCPAETRVAHAARFAWAPYDTVPETTPAEIDRMALDSARRVRGGRGIRLPPAARSPLTRLLRGRESSRTFADRPVPAGVLSAILWAAYGVTVDLGNGLFRRTVPSAGRLYEIDWYVAMLRPMPGIAAGLFKLECSADGATLLRPLEGRSVHAWLMLKDPRALTFAHALLCPVANVDRISAKYANRALVFAATEAGHACQNAALMASSQGAASCLQGYLIQSEILRVFGIPVDRFPLPALALGALPAASQVQIAIQAANFPVHWASARPGMAAPGPESYAAVSGPIPIPGGDIWTGGRDADPVTAIDKAEAEAWERIGWARPDGLVTARYGELPGAVDPRSLVAYSARQYRRAGFKLSPFSERAKYLWKQGRDESGGKPVWLLADCIYCTQALPVREQRRIYTFASTSGAAAWLTRAGAFERALLELVERDALMLAWAAAETPRLLTDRSLPGDLLARLQRLRRAGHVTFARTLTNEFAPVCLIVAQNLARQCTLFGSAAGRTFEAAFDAALAEVETQLPGSEQVGTFVKLKPRAVSSARDHPTLYRQPASFRDADFLFQKHRTTGFAAAAKQNLKTGDLLVERFAGRGYSPLSVDITPAGASIRQGRTAICVMRAFVPGLVPIWFGWGNEAFGLRRLHAALAQSGSSESQLSRKVHPIG